jgi:hypothetical protein
VTWSACVQWAGCRLRPTAQLPTFCNGAVKAHTAKQSPRDGFVSALTSMHHAVAHQGAILPGHITGVPRGHAEPSSMKVVLCVQTNQSILALAHKQGTAMKAAETRYTAGQKRQGTRALVLAW